MNQDEKLNIIKDILLTDEREFASSIEEKLSHLESIINQQGKLSEKVDPIIDSKLKTFVKDIPETLGPTITEALKEEIKNSQDAVVEALFPIMGKMIKRYVQHEIKLLSERVNEQFNKTFSFKRFFQRKKSNIKGVSSADYILHNQLSPKIEQVIVIEKGSGLVLGEYSKEKMTDEDMVAGMLTAIKSFAQDAFKKESQDLTYIEYDHYHIHIQNFSSFYIAAAISGAYNILFRDKLEDRLYDFVQLQLNQNILKDKTLVSNKLKHLF